MASPAWAEGPETGASSDFTVLADESLRVPLSRIARDYTARNGSAVTLWFASAGGMTDAIRDGADADLVITADNDALKALEFSGQIDVYATQALASSPLVLASVKNEVDDSTIDILSRRYREGKPLTVVSVEAPHSIEQRLSDKAFEGSELLRGENVLALKASNVNQVVQVMKREQAIGLMLAVDVFSRADLTILQRFPESVVPTAIYKAAVLAGERMEESRRFIEQMHGKEANATLSKYGLSSAE